MQRPRRTSEFQEEPGTSSRQSRIPLRGTSSTGPSPANFGTAQKYNTRQTASVTGTLHKTGPTPQKTPIHSARRLFSVEKQRPIALHNDKNWIQCQAQRLTDYLQRSWKPGNMENISEDFLARPNFLRQMSIKQFVSIINYFLRFIWGNRHLVGSNHVDDIVNILQKLDYPHQVNKSWLKTPNTTHSFGYVMMLFDFLMDFVPDPDFDFPLQELPETQIQSDENIPDLEFKATLLKNCQVSFHLWDKQMEEDFENIKHQTADLLVQKHCNVPGLNELDIEIERLNKVYETVQKERPFIAPEDERQCERLKEYLENTNRELEKVFEMYNEDGRKLENLLIKKQKCLVEIANIEKENENCEKAITKQICNIKQRDTYIEKKKLLHLELQSYEHTVDDLRQRDLRQQVQLSVVKMTITKVIENINKTLRDLIFTFSINDTNNELQIALNVDIQYVKRLIPSLKGHFDEIQKKIEVHKEEMRKVDINIEKLNHEIGISLKPQIKIQGKALQNELEACKNYEKRISNEFEEILTRKQNTDDQFNQFQLEMEILQKHVDDNKLSLQKLERENEEMLQKAEVAHEARSTTEMAFLDQYETNLEEAQRNLDKLEEFVETRRKS